MGVPLHQVDAFADAAFRGNPAAVCVLDGPADEGWMQSVAAEMNLSETAFLSPADEAWALRWFTPTVEVELCGHATLASAHVLWETGRVAPDDEARFDTRFRGRLVARRRDGSIELDLPADPPSPIDVPDGLAAALGAEPRSVAIGNIGWVVDLADAATIRTLTPDIGGLERLGPIVVVTAPGDEGFDYVCRVFGPAFGIEEDPVTGAAQCALAPLWHSRLGRAELRGYQASARGGVVAVRDEGDRVAVAGTAVTVLKGELTV
jgi:predicted PhzF superfamily epimerase YddE/YHI9